MGLWRPQRDLDPPATGVPRAPSAVRVPPLRGEGRRPCRRTAPRYDGRVGTPSRLPFGDCPWDPPTGRTARRSARALPPAPPVRLRRSCASARSGVGRASTAAPVGAASSVRSAPRSTSSSGIGGGCNSRRPASSSASTSVSSSWISSAAASSRSPADAGSTRASSSVRRKRASGERSSWEADPHRAPVPSWPAPAEISPQERPFLSSQRFPSSASRDTLNSISAEAYRRGVPAHQPAFAEPAASADSRRGPCR